MYNTDLIVTYYDDALIFLETDNLNEKEKEFVRNYIYRQEFLDIFDLEELTENITIINDLYSKIKTCKELRECMKLAVKNIKETIHLFNSEISGLILLYSYQFMYLTHVCVSEYLNTGKIKEDNINKLKKELEIN
jgi:hypothetical protein